VYVKKIHESSCESALWDNYTLCIFTQPIQARVRSQYASPKCATITVRQSSKLTAQHDCVISAERQWTPTMQAASPRRAPRWRRCHRLMPGMKKSSSRSLQQAQPISVSDVNPCPCP